MFLSKFSNSRDSLQYKKPHWYTELEDKFKASVSNTFLLTGNIADYAIPGGLFDKYLVHELKQLKTKTFAGFSRIISFDAYNEGEILHSADTQGKKVRWDELMSCMANKSVPTALIINHPSFLFGNGVNFAFAEEKKHLLSFIQLMQNADFFTSNNMVIIVSETRSSLPSALLGSTSRLTPINVSHPNFDERLSFIEYLEESESVTLKKEISNTEFANLTAGLSRLDIEDIKLLAESIGALKTEMIIDRKNELISKEYGDVIEIYDTRNLTLSDYGGQEHIKEQLMYDLINPLKNGDIKSVPKGILFTGAPGTGKTYLSQCLAGSAGINFIEFKMSKILNKYVGESEQNLEKAFNCFRSMAPVGVFIDEVDQALSRGDNHSNSVASNMFGMFLAFMSKEEHRGKIIFIGATNYPNKLDEALKRTGRFDIKIPFFVPTKEDRIKVLDIHFKKRNVLCEMNEKERDIVSKMTEGYTQAEIENIVVKAIKLAKRKDVDVVDFNLIETAINTLVFAQSDKIVEMTELALNEVNDYDYLDDYYGEIKRMMINKGISYQKALNFKLLEN